MLESIHAIRCDFLSPQGTIAQNLSVSIGTVCNVCKLFEQTGRVDPSKQDHSTMRQMFD